MGISNSVAILTGYCKYSMILIQLDLKLRKYYLGVRICTAAHDYILVILRHLHTVEWPAYLEDDQLNDRLDEPEWADRPEYLFSFLINNNFHQHRYRANMSRGILSPIFSLCIEKYVSVPESSISSPEPPPTVSSLCSKDAPWNLGQVCRRWRMVVQSTPSLWSEVRLVLDNPDESRSHALQLGYLLSRQLHFASSHPLTVLLRCDKPTDRSLFLIQTLLSSSERWQTLSLHLDPAKFQVLNQLEGAMPELENLFFWQCPSIGPGSSPAIFSLSYKLRRAVTYSIESPYLTFPTRCLTHLFERNAPTGTPGLVHETLAVKASRLRMSPLLKEYHFICPCEQDHLQRSSSLHNDIRLEHLNTLMIVHRGASDLCKSLIRSIVAPQLGVLTLDGRFDVAGVTTLIERSSCSLVGLILLAPTVTQEQQHMLLEKVPSLHTLGTSSPHNLFNLLDGSEGQFLPRLSVLVFAGDPHLLPEPLKQRLKQARPHLTVRNGHTTIL